MPAPPASSAPAPSSSRAAGFIARMRPSGAITSTPCSSSATTRWVTASWLRRSSPRAREISSWRRSCVASQFTSIAVTKQAAPVRPAIIGSPAPEPSLRNQESTASPSSSSEADAAKKAAISLVDSTDAAVTAATTSTPKPPRKPLAACSITTSASRSVSAWTAS